jgi:hypothetical protein
MSSGPLRRCCCGRAISLTGPFEIRMKNKITFLYTLPAASAVENDPIYAAIEQHRKFVAESDRLYDELQKAENAAEKKHGRRPSALIAWRSYSAIGASEIDDRREEFLRQPGADRKQVEREYRDAKDRARAAARAGLEWDKRTGVAPLRQLYERTRRAETAVGRRMAKTKPTTPAGAAALVDYVRHDIEIGEGPEWHKIALATTAAALSRMSLPRA